MLNANGCEDCSRAASGYCPQHAAKFTYSPTYNLAGEGKLLRPYVCPICAGKGIVPNGFYLSTNETWGTSSTTPDPCRTCGGQGIVWG